MSYKMDNLFNIFEREKNRLSGEMTLFYNKAENYLRYSNDDGRMYVFFDEAKGEEQFYYRGTDEPRTLSPEMKAKDEERFKNRPEIIERQKKFGACVQVSTNHGETNYMITDEAGKIRLYNLPKAFFNAVASYSFDRKEIGIEKQKPKNKNNYQQEI